MITTPKTLLYAAIIITFSILLVNCEEAPSIKSICKVTLDNESPVTVYSVNYFFDDSIQYSVGHSTFTIPFKDIHKLEIFKEIDKYLINITDVNMNVIERRELAGDSYLTGTADDNGIKGEFEADIWDYNKIVIIGIDSEPKIGAKADPLTMGSGFAKSIGKEENNTDSTSSNLTNETKI